MSSLESMMMNPDKGPKINTGSVQLDVLKQSGTNFAYAVIVLLGQVGIGRAANNIEDKASEQRQLAKGQGLLSSISQFFSLLEGNTSWLKGGHGDTSHPCWPEGFEQNNMSSFNDMIKSFDQLFWNGSVPMIPGSSGSIDHSGEWEDSSANTNSMNIFLQLPKAISLPGGGSIPQGTEVGMNPCTGVIRINGQPPNSAQAAAIKPMVNNIQSFLRTGIEEMLDVSPQQANEILFGNAAGKVNSTVRNLPRFVTILASELQSNMDDTPTAAMSSLMEKGSGLTNWFGSILADPTMSALHGLYNLMNSTTFTVNGKSDVPKGTWTITQIMKDLIHKRGPNEHFFKDGVVAVMWEVFGKMMADYEKDKMSGTKASSPMGHNENDLDNLKYVTWLSASGLFNETQSSIQQATSTLQSQSQQTAADLQQESSVLTSYDQIGQSMITALNKSLQTMVQNLKSG